MTRMNLARRGALLVTTMLVGLGGVAVTAGPEAAATTSAHRTAAAGQRTEVAFLVDGCNRCHVRLYQAVRGRQHVWESRTHRVRDGRVSFDVATRRTHGLSASVSAPWEGNVGAVTQIAFRYAHEPVGSFVDDREARGKRRASGCWAGTTEKQVLLPLAVRKARITGVDGSPTTAARAWIGTTTQWWRPMLHAYKGILGAQDVIFCERP
jgi:hypothetical protein